MPPLASMTLEQAEAWLLDLELFGMRFGLERMHSLTTALGLPQRRFASIHVVGSNGKSSTARMIAAILEREGLRTGLYTSPHLRSFRERVEVGERPLTAESFAAAVGRAAEAVEVVERTLEDDDRVTQFEALTGAAFHALAGAGVEVAVIEAGLGGRHDATNVIPSRVQVLTNVDLEHTRWLGDTVGEIAGEKLAVVPSLGHLVTGDLHPEAEAVAERVVLERGARRTRARADGADPLGLAGAYQRRNFALARTAAEAFLERPPSEEALARAADEVRVAGRLEVTGRDPLVVLDAAHNPAGARALAAALPELVGARAVVAVVAVLEDKDVRGILHALAPHCSGAVLTRASNPRSLSPGRLAALWPGAGPVEQVDDPHAALARARGLAGEGGAVLVTGSIYLLADLARAQGVERGSTL